MLYLLAFCGEVFEEFVLVETAARHASFHNFQTPKAALRPFEAVVHSHVINAWGDTVSKDEGTKSVMRKVSVFSGSFICMKNVKSICTCLRCSSFPICVNRRRERAIGYSIYLAYFKFASTLHKVVGTNSVTKLSVQTYGGYFLPYIQRYCESRKRLSLTRCLTYTFPWKSACWMETKFSCNLFLCLFPM